MQRNAPKPNNESRFPIKTVAVSTGAVLLSGALFFANRNSSGPAAESQVPGDAAANSAPVPEEVVDSNPASSPEKNGVVTVPVESFATLTAPAMVSKLDLMENVPVIQELFTNLLSGIDKYAACTNATQAEAVRASLMEAAKEGAEKAHEIYDAVATSPEFSQAAQLQKEAETKIVVYDPKNPSDPNDPMWYGYKESREAVTASDPNTERQKLLCLLESAQRFAYGMRNKLDENELLQYPDKLEGALRCYRGLLMQALPQQIASIQGSSSGR